MEKRRGEREKVRVTERALVQRLRRKLRTEGEELRRSRGTQALLDFGPWYTVDIKKNWIARKEFALEDLARQLGVVRPFEEVAT